MQKRILLFVLFAAAVAAIVWKLRSNKQQLAAETELSKIAPAHIPVEVVQPQWETLSNRLEADGVFMPIKEMFVISETAGRVVEVYKNKGDWANEGDLIAKVDDELLRIEWEAVEANLAKLRKDKERLNNLIEGEAVPKNKIEEVELGILVAESKKKGLQKQINNTSIKATMNGTIGLRFIERGSVIGPGIQVAQMTNLEKLTLYVKVTERDILNIRKGQSVSVSADVYPGTPIPGRVTNIGLKADNTFNYDVEIELVNPKSTPLRGGMHAKAIFRFDTNRKGLVIPRKAVVGSIQDGKVFVIKDSVARLQSIGLGNLFSDKIEVRSGLNESDRVVVSGQSNLSEGAKVAVMEK